MKTKVNMSKAALLIELGWEPINDFLNRQRASYFSYINNLPNKRLCKIVFDEMHALSAHAWDYLPALQTVFESVGFDYLYHVNDFNKEKFNAFMGQFSSTKLKKEMKSRVNVLSVTILHSIDTKGSNPISKIREILRDLDLNFFVEPIRCA